jgi:Domain of unknown function (DUF4920)
MRLSALCVPLLAGLVLSLPALAEGDCKHKGPMGCGHGHEGEAKEGTKSDAKPTERPAGWTLARGDKMTGAPAVTLSKLLEDPAPHSGQVRTVDGVVRKACSRKGCWMELAATADSKAPGVRVTFKDYAFFVPTDSAGLQAKVEGVVSVEELPEATAKHFASEGAQIARGPDGKAREVQLVASAVELRK